MTFIPCFGFGSPAQDWCSWKHAVVVWRLLHRMLTVCLSQRCIIHWSPCLLRHTLGLKFGPTPLHCCITPHSYSLSISIFGVIQIYADDICYSKPIFTNSDLLSIQQDIDKLLVWIANKGLQFNSKKKTKSLVVSRKLSPPTLSVTVMTLALCKPYRLNS